MEILKHEILINDLKSNDFTLTVFVGLFNGVKYLPSLLDQLKNQSDQRFNLLIVDNFSTDETLRSVEHWGGAFRGRFMVIRNSLNYGGMGSCILSISKMNTPWFTALHQDDFYFPNHIHELNKAISKCKLDTVAISTSMKSMNQSGGHLLPPPRANWYLSKTNKKRNFLQNLQMHSIPSPSVAYRCSQFADFAADWHSTIADNLLVLRLSTKGGMETIFKETMVYRENEQSESHNLNEDERMITTSLGLVRFFSSSEFIDLTRSINEIDRSSFVKSVNRAISIRLKKTPLSDFTRLFANESMMTAWGYSEQTSIKNVKGFFDDIDSSFTSPLLERIIMSFEDVHSEAVDLNSCLSSLAGASQTNVVRGLTNITNSQLLGRIGSVIPFSIRRILWRLVVRISRRKNISWDFREQ
jgi:glycosyltransferase involved in cell wall biosynthesis